MLLGLALLSSECLCVFSLRGVIYICILNFFLLTYVCLPFSELCSMGFALDLVGEPSSFNAVTLLVGSFDR